MPRVTQPRPAAARRRADGQRGRRRPMSPRLRWALRGGAVAALILALGGGGHWLWRSGATDDAGRWLQARWLNTTAAAGLRVQEVLVYGRAATSAEEVLAALAVQQGEPILGFDPGDARDRLEALPWIRHAVVERRLPDRIVVRLEERRPLARWQLDQRLTVIDHEGAELTTADADVFGHLPLFVGTDAPAHAQSFLAVLQDAPTVARRVAAIIRVGGRRWDLRLDNGVTVQLPTTDAAGALRRLAEMQERTGLFERDIVVIDLRLADRLSIRTSPMASQRRRLPEQST